MTSWSGDEGSLERVRRGLVVRLPVPALPKTGGAVDGGAVARRVAEFLRDGRGLLVVPGAPELRAWDLGPADAVVRVRGLTSVEVVERLVVALGGNPVWALLSGLRLPALREQVRTAVADRERLTVVLDGLHHAADPARLAADVVGPLLRLAGPEVKLVVGADDELLPLLRRFAGFTTRVRAEPAPDHLGALLHDLRATATPEHPATALLARWAVVEPFLACLPPRSRAFTHDVAHPGHPPLAGDLPWGLRPRWANWTRWGGHLPVEPFQPHALLGVPVRGGRTLLASRGFGNDRLRLWDLDVVEEVEGVPAGLGAPWAPIPGSPTLIAAGVADEWSCGTRRCRRSAGGRRARTGCASARSRPCRSRTVCPLLSADADDAHLSTAVTLPDGRTALATSGQDEMVRLWDVTRESRERTTWAFRVEPATAPDGRTVLAEGEESLVRLSDESGEVLWLALDCSASVLLPLPASAATGGVPLLAVVSETGFTVLEVRG